MSDTEFAERMLAWINERMAPPGTVVTAKTLLFAEGIISSIKVLDLIAWTERAISREVRDAEIRLDNFKSVERIAEVFAGKAEHASV